MRSHGYVLGDRPRVVVIGGANVDVKARSAARVRQGTSNPGHISMTPGGVGRNVAENLARLGTRTFLVAAVGRDAAGEGLLNQTAAAGVRVEYVRTDQPTGTYVALLDCDGEMVAAVADMAATSALGPEEVNRARDVIATAGLVVLDGNLDPEPLITRSTWPTPAASAQSSSRSACSRPRDWRRTSAGRCTRSRRIAMSLPL